MVEATRRPASGAGPLQAYDQGGRWLLVCGAGINLLSLVLPLAILLILDRALPSRSLSLTAAIIIGTTVALLLDAGLRTARAQFTAWAAARFEHGVTDALGVRLLRMPMGVFEAAGTGVHMDRFREAGSLRGYAADRTLDIVDGPFVVFQLVILAAISPWLAAVLLLVGLAQIRATAQFGARTTQLTDARLETDARRTNFLVETLRQIHTVKSISMELLMLRRYERLQESTAQALRRLSVHVNIQMLFSSIIGPLASAIITAAGAVLVLRGHITSGELAASLFLSFRALTLLQALGSRRAKRAGQVAARERLANQLDGTTEPDADLPVPQNGPLGLRVEGVSFTYPGTKAPVVRDLNISVEPGQVLLLRGATGSGRSTLLQLIAGELAPERGRIALTDISRNDYAPERARPAIALLPPQSTLFEGSLLDNVTLFDPSRVDAALEHAQALGVSDLVQGMPQGWQTAVGASAAEAVPPGLRQLLGVVRGLAQNPGIVLFDDATSSVDGRGDAAVIAALSALKGKATLVLVTQRPSLQKLADVVLEMGGGQDTAASALAEVPEPVGAPSGLVAEPDEGFWRQLNDAALGAFSKPGVLPGLLAPLLRELGWRGAPRDLVEVLPFFDADLDPIGLANAMARLGYDVSEVRTTAAGIDPRGLPCVFIPDAGEPRLYSVSRGRPADQGEGVALFFRVRDEEDAGAAGWSGATLSRMTPMLLQAVASSFAIALLTLLGSLFTLVVYDSVLPSGSARSLPGLLGGLLAALAVACWLGLRRSALLGRVAGRLEYLFGSAAVRKILALPPSLTERASVGSQIARLSSFEAVRDVFLSPTAAMLVEAPATVLIAIVLCVVNPAAVVVLAFAVAANALLYLWLGRSVSKDVRRLGRTATRKNEFIVEMITKMRAIREVGGRRIWATRLREISAAASTSAFQAERNAAVLTSLSNGVMSLSGLAIVGLSTPMVLDGKLGAGGLIVSMILIWRVLTPIQTLFSSLPRLERVRTATSQFDALMRLPDETSSRGRKDLERRISGDVVFSRVSFRYSLEADPALLGVSVNIPRGALVAVTGGTGSGKSTFMKLILGLYPPQAGSVRIDGVDLRQMNLHALRQQIGYAPQEAQLFRATILQNVRFARPDATEAEVKAALAMANALEQVEALPKGLNYRIADNASDQLPAGLRHAISLARAYISDAPILLLDEPGAALDVAGDQQFIALLKWLRGRKTVIFSSHRPSHIRLADSVLTFEGGYLQSAMPPEQWLAA